MERSNLNHHGHVIYFAIQQETKTGTHKKDEKQHRRNKNCSKNTWKDNKRAAKIILEEHKNVIKYQKKFKENSNVENTMFRNKYTIFMYLNMQTRSFDKDWRHQLTYF